jgi:hypothetical protein
MDELTDIEGDPDCNHESLPFMPVMGMKCRKCHKTTLFNNKKDAYGVSYEARWIESSMIINAIGEAMDGEEPSDFELSFPIVRQAYDLYKKPKGAPK